MSRTHRDLPPEEATTQESTSQARAQRPRTVLLVEDNPGDRMLVDEALEAAELPGITIEAVGTLREAEERLAESRFGLVLLDLLLPDSMGLDTLDKLRAHDPDVPVVVLTALSGQDMAVEMVRRGATHFLLKDNLNSYVLESTLRAHMPAAAPPRQTAAALRAILDRVPMATLMVDGNNNVVHMGAQMRDHLGPDHEGLVGQPAENLFPEAFDAWKTDPWGTWTRSTFRPEGQPPQEVDVCRSLHGSDAERVAILWLHPVSGPESGPARQLPAVALALARQRSQDVVRLRRRVRKLQGLVDDLGSEADTRRRQASAVQEQLERIVQETTMPVMVVTEKLVIARTNAAADGVLSDAGSLGQEGTLPWPIDTARPLSATYWDRHGREREIQVEAHEVIWHHMPAYLVIVNDLTPEQEQDRWNEALEEFTAWTSREYALGDIEGMATSLAKRTGLAVGVGIAVGDAPGQHLGHWPETWRIASPPVHEVIEAGRPRFLPAPSDTVPNAQSSVVVPLEWGYRRHGVAVFHTRRPPEDAEAASSSFSLLGALIGLALGVHHVRRSSASKARRLRRLQHELDLFASAVRRPLKALVDLLPPDMTEARVLRRRLEDVLSTSARAAALPLIPGPKKQIRFDHMVASVADRYRLPHGPGTVLKGPAVLVNVNAQVLEEAVDELLRRMVPLSEDGVHVEWHPEGTGLRIEFSGPGEVPIPDDAQDAWSDTMPHLFFAARCFEVEGGHLDGASGPDGWRLVGWVPDCVAGVEHEDGPAGSPPAPATGTAPETDADAA